MQSTRERLKQTVKAAVTPFAPVFIAAIIIGALGRGMEMGNFPGDGLWQHCY